MSPAVADRVEVELSQRQVVCPAHIAPFRADWPLGWDAFATIVAQAALDNPMLQTGLPDPRFWKFDALFWNVNQDEGWRNVTVLPETRASVTRIRQMLFDRPACEWLQPRALFGAYKATGIGVMGMCAVCHQFAEGATYPVKSGRDFAVIPHVCWQCVTRKAALG